jgi:hypothetical protein
MKCTTLITADKLVLPATDLSVGCYLAMFKLCTNLTKAPKKLSATYVSRDAYREMFEGCSSLSKAPDINAYEIESTACYKMFTGCDSLNYIKFMPIICQDNFTEIGAPDWAENGTLIMSSNAQWDKSYIEGLLVEGYGWTIEYANE